MECVGLNQLQSVLRFVLRVRGSPCVGSNETRCRSKGNCLKRVKGHVVQKLLTTRVHTYNTDFSI